MKKTTAAANGNTRKKSVPTMPTEYIRDQNFDSAGGSPRSCECFDSGWKFLRGDASGAEWPDFDEQGWRSLDLPHDWSIEDLPAIPKEPTPDWLSITRGRWRFQKGDDPAWKEPALDDSAWQEVDLPCTWEAHSNYTEDNVYGWYRRRVTIPPELRGKGFILAVGKVDDVDETFFNGQKIGGMGTFPPRYVSAYDKARLYRVPRELVREDGENVVAVRVFDGPMFGGIYAEAGGPAVQVGPFDTEVTEGGRDTGYMLGGMGWYRKTFVLPKGSNGRIVSLHFDGVYMNADVWVNGAHLGNHPYGYTAFGYELTRHLHHDGKPNLIAVRVNNNGRNTRWYSGSGIYRHTWLVTTNPVHIPQWGVSITTPKVNTEKASVRIATTVENAGAAPQDLTLTTRLLDPKGRPAGKAVSPVRLEAGQRREFVQQVEVTRPKLWSVDAPNLYSAHTEVAVGRETTDGLRTPFGIRTIRFDAKKGFSLNGVPMKLKGACMHHDNGPLGSAALDRAEVRRVELMKANGYNAIRTSHNPPSQVFLDACDRLGMLVMDEAFDMWRVKKNNEDYHLYFDLWWRRDIDSMVLRDRNHPSVILWSIGNEIMERAEQEGYRTAWMLADYVRQLDPTRPVSCAICGMDSWEKSPGSYAPLDVGGYNYQIEHYEEDHKRFPLRIMAATESFPAGACKYWMAVLDHPYVIGDFVWTGFDYLGESGIGQSFLEGNPNNCDFPWHIAYCGDIDICGRKRQQSYYRDVLWGCGSKLHIAVHRPIPEGRKAAISLWGWPDVHVSWTWPGHENHALEVFVYSGCEEVTLLLNGREIGTQTTSRATEFTATFAVPYEPGELRAIGRVGGKIVAECVLQTTGQPYRLRLTPDRSAIFADRNDLSYVTCEVLDKDGLVVPNATNHLRFFVEGKGALAAQANGNPRDAVSYRAPERDAHEGQCLLVIRPEGKPGRIRVRAESEGLEAGQTEIRVQRFPST